MSHPCSKSVCSPQEERLAACTFISGTLPSRNECPGPNRPHCFLPSCFCPFAAQPPTRTPLSAEGGGVLVPHSLGWALGPKPEERRGRGTKPEEDAEPDHRDGFCRHFREPTGGLRVHLRCADTGRLTVLSSAHALSRPPRHGRGGCRGH